MGRAYQVRKASMEKTSATKSKLYAKYGKEILIAAKGGIPDPLANLVLKRVIEKARENQVPTDVINRAIDKAKSKEVDDFVQYTYECFGPGESTLIIECLTDNSNRTIANIKTCLNKCHSKLGVGGSVSFGYRHASVVSLSGASEEKVFEVLLNRSIPFNDIEVDDDFVTVFGEITDLYEIKTGLEEGLKSVAKIEQYENLWIPNDYVNLSVEDKEVFERLLNMLDQVDDVQDVYHNVNL